MPAAMELPAPRQSASLALWERARRVMPGGVYGHQNGAVLGEGHPRFLARAERSRVWDVDGNEYVDWMCAYGPMILGYGHPAVESAVAEQVAAGDCLPLPGPRMVELAERLVALTPRADLVVFGKNGADATSWAVDVARAHTGRPRIVRARGAYHAARPWALPHLAGVPAHHRDELLEFGWNDLDGLRACFAAHPGEIAVVMTTPFDHQTGAAPAPGFFAGLRALCDEHGALFAMDDVRAGFRFHLGGSCEHWGAAPDLICYSKAIANGHALSAALAREALRAAAERIYFTGSFFFASGAFAAALATLAVLEHTDAIGHIRRIGGLLVDGLAEQARRLGVPLLPVGQPAMPVIRFADDPERARIRRWCSLVTQGGAYAHPAHNWFVSAAHTEEDVARTLAASERAFRAVAAEA
jgi:glutamate-1-semialdehyde 2,1-aminomutase